MPGRCDEVDEAAPVSQRHPVAMGPGVRPEDTVPGTDRVPGGARRATQLRDLTFATAAKTTKAASKFLR